MDRRRQGVVAAVAVVVGMGWSGVQAAWAMDPAAVPGELRWVPTAWMIESAQYTGTLEEQVARFEVRYTVQVVEGGIVQIPLELPGVTVTSVTLEHASRHAHVAPRGGAYVLIASRPGAYRLRVRGAVRVFTEGQYERLSFGIPQATSSLLTLTIPRTDVELRPEDRLIAEVRPGASGSTLTVQLGASSRIDVGWRVQPAKPEIVEPVLQGTVQTLVTVEEQRARLVTMIAYRLLQGAVKELRLQLPSRMTITNVRGASIGDWRVSPGDGASLLTVTLAEPLKEAASYQLVLEAEDSLTVSQASYAVPALVLLGVKQEQGDVAIARQGNLELSPSQVEGVRRVDVRELPEALRASSPSAIVLGFAYHQHPYHVELGLTRHEDHPVLAAIAEQAELVSVISRDGDLITRAVYLIKANRQQFLTVTLPEGATLWSCLVAGEAMKPVDGPQGQLRIPLDRAGEPARGIPVELVYVARHPRMRGLGHLRLQGPTLDVPTTVANWFVYAPQDVQWLRVSGNVERGAVPVQFVDDPIAPMSRSHVSGVSGMLEERDEIGQGDGGEDKGMFKQLFRATRRKRGGMALDSAASREDWDGSILNHQQVAGQPEAPSVAALQQRGDSAAHDPASEDRTRSVLQPRADDQRAADGGCNHRGHQPALDGGGRRWPVRALRGRPDDS